MNLTICANGDKIYAIDRDSNTIKDIYHFNKNDINYHNDDGILSLDFEYDFNDFIEIAFTNNSKGNNNIANNKESILLFLDIFIKMLELKFENKEYEKFWNKIIKILGFLNRLNTIQKINYKLELLECNYYITSNNSNL